MNLFLTEGGVLKLGYYGLTTQRELYSIKGSDWVGVRTFAPEAKRGKYEMKSGVWSLGMALIEMMGIIPYSEWDNTIHKENGSDAYHLTALQSNQTNCFPSCWVVFSG